MRSWISEESIHFWIVRKRDVEEMIEIVKNILIVVGMVTIACVIICFAIEFKEKFKSWRKNGCKIKFLRKHEYDVEFASSLFGEISLKCRKCGKKKIIKNLSSELVDKLWWGGRDEE